MDYIALTDVDGDPIGPIITSASELCRRYLKSFDPKDKNMAFVVHCSSKVLSNLDRKFDDSQGILRLRGVCEKDLKNTSAFHVSAEYSWHEIIDAFCQALLIHDRSLISHLQIWNLKGDCVGPPLVTKEIFINECRNSYFFDKGMFVAAIYAKE